MLGYLFNFLNDKHFFRLKSYPTMGREKTKNFQTKSPYINKYHVQDYDQKKESEIGLCSKNTVKNSQTHDEFYENLFLLFFQLLFALLA